MVLLLAADGRLMQLNEVCSADVRANDRKGKNKFLGQLGEPRWDGRAEGREMCEPAKSLLKKGCCHA